MGGRSGARCFLSPTPSSYESEEGRSRLYHLLSEETYFIFISSPSLSLFPLTHQHPKEEKCIFLRCESIKVSNLLAFLLTTESINPTTFLLGLSSLIELNEIIFVEYLARRPEMFIAQN